MLKAFFFYKAASYWQSGRGKEERREGADGEINGEQGLLIVFKLHKKGFGMSFQGPKAKQRTEHIMAVKLFLVKFRFLFVSIKYHNVLYYHCFLVPSLG